MDEMIVSANQRTPTSPPRLGRIALHTSVAVVVLSLTACSRTPTDSPEDQIRALVAKGEKAAEEKDMQTLKSLVADTYSDKQGNKKAEILKVVAFHLLRNESVHLLTRIRTIEFPEPKRAAVTVFVAMAGGKLGGVDDLLRLRADLYRVEFTAADEGRADWKVTSAEWRPADTSDFE